MVGEQLLWIVKSGFENDWLLDVKFGPEVALFIHVLNELNAWNRFHLFNFPRGNVS